MYITYYIHHSIKLGIMQLTHYLDTSLLSAWGFHVEIRIYVDAIQIINYPGIELWINMDKYFIGKVTNMFNIYMHLASGSKLSRINLCYKRFMEILLDLIRYEGQKIYFIRRLTNGRKDY